MRNDAIQQNIKHDYINLPTQADLLDFAQDAADMFLRRKQGHMERWEYFRADYLGDPAGGGIFWDQLIKAPGAYYIPQEDQKMIAQALQMPEVIHHLKRLKIIAELGPGSQESIEKKTLPFLRYAEQYIAVDQCIDHADQAVDYIRDTKRIQANSVISDYHAPDLGRFHQNPIGFIMWGVAIGNIEGGWGSDPFWKLVDIFKKLRRNCKSGDAYFIGNDTEQNKDKVLAAYHEPLLSKKFLSILFALDKFGFVKGNFNPQVWRHKSIWAQDVSQCAHCLYPLIPQDFEIMGHHIKAKPGELFIENNSYKIKPDVITEAARAAGFNEVFTTSSRPIAMTVMVA